jgi:hypothetical protein
MSRRRLVGLRAMGALLVGAVVLTVVYAGCIFVPACGCDDCCGYIDAGPRTCPDASRYRCGDCTRTVEPTCNKGTLVCATNVTVADCICSQPAPPPPKAADCCDLCGNPVATSGWACSTPEGWFARCPQNTVPCGIDSCPDGGAPDGGSDAQDGASSD